MEALSDVLGVTMAILAVLVALAIRMAFETWQYVRNKQAIVTVFGRQGAVDPASARRLEDLGLKLYTWRLGLRDYRAETMRVLVQNGFVQKTVDGRFYLSPEARQFYTTHCRDWPD